MLFAVLAVNNGT